LNKPNMGRYLFFNSMTVSRTGGRGALQALMFTDRNWLPFTSSRLGSTV
jgi:hypothetical protein